MLKSNDASYFEIRAITDEGYREAIGGVCIHWALLELTVERVLANLESGSTLLRYDAQLATNLDRLSALVETSTALAIDQREKLRQLLTEVKSTRDERHRLVHGLWGRDANGVVHSIFPAISRKPDPARPISVDDIRQTKRRIFRLGKRLRAYVNPSEQVQIKWERD